jgi:hypothetical protein
MVYYYDIMESDRNQPRGKNHQHLHNFDSLHKCCR